MTITVERWNGHDVQDATYQALLDSSAGAFARAGQQVQVQPPGSWARHIRGNPSPRPVTLLVQVISGDLNTAQRQLSEWFAFGTEGELEILEDGTAKVLDAVCLGFQRYANSSNQFVATLVAPDPRWRGVNPISAASLLTASGQSFSVNNPGNSPVDDAVISLRPVVNKAAASGYLYSLESIIAWRAERPSGLYAIEITGGGWDHATEVAAGRSQADGDDVRVLVDGIEVPRWFGENAATDANSAQTNIWINLSFSPRRTATLLNAVTAILPNEAGELVVNKGGTLGFPRAGALLVDDEVILYTGRTESNADGNAAFTGVTRAARNTTAAAHSAAATCYWVEHRVQIVYGNTGASAPDARADLKPLLDLTHASLSNSRHEQTVFADEDNPGRSMPWTSTLAIIGADESYPYVQAATGSPLASMVHEISRDGASAEKPNRNVWERDFPTGLKPLVPVARTATTGTFSASASVVVTKPTNTADGDLLLVTFTGAQAVDTPPAGWTSLTVTTGLKVYWKIASSEGASWTWTLVAGDTGVWACEAYTDVSVAYDSHAGTNTGAPVTALSSPYSLVIHIARRADGSTYTAPAGFTERADVANGASISLGLFDRTFDRRASVSASATASGGTPDYQEIVAFRLGGSLVANSAIGDTLALDFHETDDDGNEALADTELGPKTAADYTPTGISTAAYRVRLRTRAAAVAKNPDPITLADTGNALTVTATDNGQQVTVGSQTTHVSKIVTVHGFTGASVGVSAAIYTDNGSDAPGTLLATSAVTTNGASADPVTVTHTFSPSVALKPSTKYWLCFSHNGGGGGTATIKYYTPLPYAEGLCRLTATNYAYRSLRFAVIPERPAAAWDDHAPLPDVLAQNAIAAVTAHLDTTQTPYVALKARQDTYRFVAATLYNETTGESVQVDTTCRVGAELRLDIAAGVAVNLDDENATSFAAGVEYSDPAARFTLAPGNNVLRFVEAGLAGVNVSVEARPCWE